jgi:hypothetical protein
MVKPDSKGEGAKSPGELYAGICRPDVIKVLLYGSHTPGLNQSD